MEEPLPPAPVPRKPSPGHTSAAPVLAGTSTPRPAGSQGQQHGLGISKWPFPKAAPPPTTPYPHPPTTAPAQDAASLWPPQGPPTFGKSDVKQCSRRVSQPGARESPAPPRPPCKMSCARGSRNPPEPKAWRGWGLRPWTQARGSECAQLCGKCSLFISALQLVKFYSARKLVTSHSNYSGLESARAMKVQGPAGIRAGVKGSSSHIFKPSGR